MYAGENFKEFFRLPTGQPESHSRLPHMNSQVVQAKMLAKVERDSQNS